MIIQFGEMHTFEQAKSKIKHVLMRSDSLKVSVGFDFVKLENRKCTYYIYVSPEHIEEVQGMFKKCDLLCLRFCEVV